MAQDVGEPAPSPAATPAAEEAAEAVPENADGAEETQQAAVTPDTNPNPDPDPAPQSPVGQPVSPSSPVAAPPAPTPTPNLSPREEKAADVPGAAAADLCAAARPASASAAGIASRTICLRTLRGSTSSGALSSLAGWGGTLAAAPAAAAAGAMEQGAPPEVAAATPSQTGAVAAVAVGAAGGGLGVLPSANKVVDLREVKKVKPGPLASAAAAAAVPVPADDSDDPEEGGGPVKIDISAGKRMIEFQLKQNVADEKREAARLKGERESADAAAAEGSQRMLAQVNARIEAQRRAVGGVLGSWGSESVADHGGGGGGNAVQLIGQSQIRNLAEKHGIVVRFVDDGAASGVAQVRALARAHGIRIQILGQDGDEGEAPLGADCAGKATTPPPILSSLRTRAATPARRSPSPVPEAFIKAPPRKAPAAPAGGMFSGPARMMRRALEASGGCVPSAKDASPEVSRGEPASISLKSSSLGDGDGDGDGGGEASTPSRRKGGVVRPRPGSGGRAGGVEAASNGVVANGGVVGGSASRNARSEGESCSSKGGGIDGAAPAAAAAASAAPSGNTPTVSGRKRREAPGDTTQIGEHERRGGHAEGTTSKRAVEGDVDGRGGGGGGAVGGRMEGRLGQISAGPAGGEGGATPSARGSKEATTTPRIQNGAPKRMRLVAPGGVVVSQAADTPSTHKSGRRTGSGGTPFRPGNNNLFKGAMAGIMGRGKRPTP